MINYHVQLIADMILMGFSASYYHIIYFMLDNNRDNINTYYSFFKKPILLMTFLFTASIINDNLSHMNGIFDVILYYSTIVYIIVILGNDSRYLILGVLIAFFLSEYWETPIYLWQIFVKGTYIEYNGIHKIYLIIKYFLKMLTIFYIKIELDSLKLNPSKLLSDFVKFSIIYIPSVFLFFMINGSNTRWGIDFNWIFRLFSFGVVLQYLYKEHIRNIILS